MEPSSDHEREIARLIDARAKEDNLPISAVAEIARTVPFPMSKAETLFLTRYIVWRRDHPFRAANNQN
jgi:hypothetical protein